MAIYKVYLETSAEALQEGGYLVHVPELIGVAARGKTKEEALEKTREAIAAHLELMRKYKLPAPPASEPIEMDVIESDAPTFPPDYAPLTEEDVENFLRREEISRDQLFDLLRAMPSAALNWRASPDAWAIRNVLAHIAQADMWYASRLALGGLPELLWRLDATRTLVVNALDELDDEARDRVTKHDDEDWTPAKVARRVLEHEREHLEQIRETLEQFQAAGRKSQ
ncbi:MAG: type II toxin-antitoxin system HicB family antitoxin [Chloroflexi bacterium]|nr:type II toxin-antitoxin system HicB family antitoxin [Chloroflexota bacterium]